MKEILNVIEFQSQEYEHLAINSKIIEDLSCKYQVELYCTNDHNNAIKFEIGDIYIHENIDINKNLLKKFIYNYQLINKKNHSKLLILSCSTAGYIALIFSFRKKNIYLIHHGLLANIASKSLLLRLIYNIIFKILFYSKLKNILLGRHISKALKSKFNINYIDLPYRVSNHQKYANLLIKRIYKSVGTIGVQSNGKGKHDVDYIYSQLCSLGYTCDIVGAGFNGNSFLKNSEYISRVENLDIVFFTYPIDSYIFTSSGAYYEAAKRGKLIIAYRNNIFFEYQKKYYDKLILVDNKFEMIEVIKRFMNTEIDSNFSLKEIVNNNDLSSII